jgi:hypothetical protein
MVSVNRSSHPCGARPIRCRRPETPHRRRARKSVPPRTTRLFFSFREAQHVKRSRAGDWLAGIATLLAVACWGVLAALLGS